MTLLKS